MRLLITTDNLDKVRNFAAILKDKHITHDLEVNTNRNWGDDKYGDSEYHLWIIDEDTFEQASDLLAIYEANPQDESLKTHSDGSQNLFQGVRPKKSRSEKIVKLIPDPPMSKNPSYITRALIAWMVLLFLIDGASLSLSPQINSSLWVPSPIQRIMLYDYPKAAELFTKVITLETKSQNTELSPEAAVLINEAQRTPYWKGYLAEFKDRFLGLTVDQKDVPWFEKIQAGEFWRTLSPAFLHAGLLHILFNMLWFWMLGKEIERGLSPARYLLLIALIAIVSNTSQYLMTGFQFVGFSGVVAGLVLFTGERQKIAPWEGYTLQKSVYLFLVIYIFGLAALEGISLISSLYNYPTIPISIANTAHLSGAFVGYILGRLNYFGWRS